MRHAFGDDEFRAIGLVRPIEHRVIGGSLGFDQLQRRVGAIAEQVGFGVGGKLGARFAHRRRDAVDRGIGDARGRHGRRIDRLALRRPFLCGEARASASVGNTSGLPAGVRAPRPSRRNAKPAATGATLAAA